MSLHLSSHCALPLRDVTNCLVSARMPGCGRLSATAVGTGASFLYCLCCSLIQHSRLPFLPCFLCCVVSSVFVPSTHGGHSTWSRRLTDTLHLAVPLSPRPSHPHSGHMPPWPPSYAARQSKTGGQTRQICPMPASARRRPQNSPCSRRTRPHRTRNSPALGLMSFMS